MRLFHRAEEDLWASKASGERPAADIPVVGIQVVGIQVAGIQVAGKPVADTAAVDTAADIETDTDTVGDPEPAEADSFVCR